MIDLDAGWQTERLGLEPLTSAHAAELALALDDEDLHRFTGGVPLSLDALTQRCGLLTARRSPDDRQLWSVAAFIHPEHVASQAVARAGMAVTDVIRDGEQCWFRRD